MVINQPNEDSIVFVHGKANQYLIIYEVEGKTDPRIQTGREIFNTMDMSDCYDIEVARLWMISGKCLTECRFRGTWHDPKENLKMQIENIITGEVYDVGYASDH